jgi:hypothetical protein
MGVPLCPQLSHIVRLLDVKMALSTLPDKARRDAASAALGVGAGGSSVAAALGCAAAAVGRVRDSCGYRWVDLGSVFGRMRPPVGLAR